MKQARYLYSELSSLITARRGCITHSNDEWIPKHTDKLLSLVRAYMPHGSGVDSGTQFDLDASHGEKLVFQMDFHHMDGNGYYDGWTEHQVIVTPSLAHHFHVRITGRNRNDIKEYLREMVGSALMEDVRYDLYIDFPNRNFTTKYAIERKLTLTCPFCMTVETRLGSSYEAITSRVAHTCDSFPGDKTNPNRYQPMNEKTTWLCAGHEFATGRIAQIWAGNAMDEELRGPQLSDIAPLDGTTNAE